jgi:hypothetical protein
VIDVVARWIEKSHQVATERAGRRPPTPPR